jgi:hypothetical protein
MLQCLLQSCSDADAAAAGALLSVMMPPGVCCSLVSCAAVCAMNNANHWQCPPAGGGFRPPPPPGPPPALPYVPVGAASFAVAQRLREADAAFPSQVRVGQGHHCWRLLLALACFSLAAAAGAWPAGGNIAPAWLTCITCSESCPLLLARRLAPTSPSSCPSKTA